ncbi:hypothetical protein FA15DRAFT_754839 [Coprinopsis marcescibilis]|uniref:Uncharacterized protein n=1 Tax=Coprinopsis marcescibilis TaxID=230819 RepID=A0A5C3LE03_COPMA|nr:hypothetical protein FA15DRAFT_754839 [Coprinopsis marcescibilis]
MVDVQLLAKDLNATLSDETISVVQEQRLQVRTELDYLSSRLKETSINDDDDDPCIVESRAPSSSKPSIRARCKELTAQLSACDTILAPYKCLPSELLTEIFLATYSLEDSSFIPVEIRSSPLALCQVCSRWRSVALEIPNLWTNVILRFSRRTDPLSLVEIAEQWFRRSGHSHLLSLVLTKRSPYLAPNWDDHPDFVPEISRRLLSPYGHRFRKLHATLPICNLFQFISRVNSSGSGTTLPKLPRLTDLGLSLDAGEHTPRVAISITALTLCFREHAANLVELSLGHFGKHFPFNGLVHLGFGSLARLTLVETSIDITRCHALWRQCSQLVHCRVNLALKRDQGVRDVRRQIMLPRLQSLSIDVSSNDLPEGPHVYRAQLDEIFSPLVASSLKELRISPHQLRGTRAWDNGAFLRFLSQSAPPLEIMAISKINLKLEDILDALPELVELQLGFDTSCKVSKEVMRRMGLGELVPQLKVLVCCVDELDDLIDLLEKRWQQSTFCDTATDVSLQRATMRLSCPDYVWVEHVNKRIAPQQASRVDKLRSFGLTIRTDH